MEKTFTSCFSFNLPIIDDFVVGLLRTLSIGVDITSYVSWHFASMAQPNKNKMNNNCKLILNIVSHNTAWKCVNDAMCNDL